MDIYLIRHTQTATPPGLCYGQSDVALAKSFSEEMSRVSKKLPEQRSDCLVFSSPLTRCLTLAKTLTATVITDVRLLEINFGDWENCRFDDLDADTLQYWTEHFVHIAPPNGESFTDLVMRVGDFWQDVLKTNAAQLLIITHAGVIRALLAHILKLPAANAFQFKIDVGSVHKFQHVNNYTYIHYLNQ
ncbi:MAG: alpha-ribazole phosphatase [Methylococcales bacterium]|nr:alpha-ribazole phosphatase [Methylococcales bacterium]